MTVIEVEKLRGFYFVSWTARDRSDFDFVVFALREFLPSHLFRWSSSAKAWSVDLAATVELRAFLEHMRESGEARVGRGAGRRLLRVMPSPSPAA